MFEIEVVEFFDDSVEIKLRRVVEGSDEENFYVVENVVVGIACVDFVERWGACFSSNQVVEGFLEEEAEKIYVGCYSSIGGYQDVVAA